MRWAVSVIVGREHHSGFRRACLGLVLMSLRRVIVVAVALLVAPSAAAWGLGARRSDRVVLRPSYVVVGHDGEQTDGSYTIFWRRGGRAVLGTLWMSAPGSARLCGFPATAVIQSAPRCPLAIRGCWRTARSAG